MSGARPLSAAQEGIWYAQAQDPSNPIFNTGQVLWIAGRLDECAMRQALAALVEETEALRMRFAEGTDGPVQWLAAEMPEVGYVDVSGEDDPESAARDAIWQRLWQPADLGAGPVGHVTLWRLGRDRWAVSQQIHHLAGDGYANVLMTNRLAALYAAFVAGEVPSEGFAGYGKVFEAEAAYAGSAREERDRAYWHEMLEGMGDVRSVKVGVPMSSDRFLRVERPVPEALRSALLARAERAGVNWAEAVTVLSAAYLWRFGTEGECVPGIPLMNRMGSPAARVPCTQVNVLPFRFVPEDVAPLDTVLEAGAGVLAAMRRHGRYRGEILRRELGRVGSGRRLHGPLINVLPFDPAPALPGLHTEMEITGAGSVDDMTIAFRGDARVGLRLQVDANPAIYGEGEISAHLDRLMGFLGAACAAERLADVPTLTPEETELHLRGRNATAQEVPDVTLAGLIEERMRAAPEAEAVRFGEAALSFAELDRRSAALAGQLARRGVGSRARVAVALPRSLELIVALVAVLRAGAAYVPLDPEDDSSRRADMLERAAPGVVLAKAGFPAEDVLPPEDWASEGAAPPGPAPENAAYVLFTSGSTGRPKGVVVSHRAIVNRLLWMRAAYGIGPGDRILQKTPATFDVSVWEFFLPLLSGATLVVAPPGAHRDPSAIAGLIRDEGITALHFVPSMLALFLEAPEARGLRIAHVFASGEALPSAMARRFHELIAGRLHNLYGPTEAAVDVSFHEASGAEEGASVPIGRPVWNTRLYVLDAALRPVPDGVTGRLYLAGRQLAEGYLGQPELTAERFVADPFVPGERMYDTGDLAFVRPDGEVVFEGRADGQVKIRGVRVETGEVEAALLATGLARQCVVLARDGVDGAAQLVAWAVTSGGADEAAIQAALEGRLPASMRPARIVVLEALPLTPNGKLDRRALPDPVRLGGATRPPAPGIEALLAGLYAEVLGETAGPETDFFLSGGDSLKAVRLTRRIAEATGVDPGLGAVFEAPVLADLALRIGAAERDSGLGPVLRLSAGRRPPVFAVHPAGGIAWCYRGLAAALEDRPLIGFQSPLLDPAEPVPESLSVLARSYAERIEALAPEGPVHVMGWSLGGLIAHAAAAELERRGREIGMVGLLDAYPSECWRDEPEPAPGAALRALLAIAGHDPEAHPELQGRAEILGFLRDRGHPLALLPDGVLDGVIRSVQATNRLVRGHREPVLRAPVLHVQAVLDHAGTDLRPDLWRPYAGGLSVEPLDCTHGALLAEAHSERLVQALEREMARAERGSAKAPHPASIKA